MALLLGHYDMFFTASAGASAAILGLLVVAVSVVNADDTDARTRERRTVLAGSAFLALVDVFFVSLVALTGGPVVFAASNLAMAIVGLLATGRLIPRAGGRELLPWLSNPHAQPCLRGYFGRGVLHPARPGHRTPGRLPELCAAARLGVGHGGVVRERIGTGLGGHRNPTATEPGSSDWKWWLTGSGGMNVVQDRFTRTSGW
jgi:hypothetical protein